MRQIQLNPAVAQPVEKVWIDSIGVRAGTVNTLCAMRALDFIALSIGGAHTVVSASVVRFSRSASLSRRAPLPLSM